jgi:multidrug efflux pump subunit AcrA (membrane-fusion protein)
MILCRTRSAVLALLAALVAAPTFAAEPHDRGGEHQQLYTCGMHPQVIRDQPGTCPICGMELTPLNANAPATSAVVIDPAVVQNMGVRTAVVSEGALQRRVRAVATLQEPAPARRDVNLRVSGWIERLYANVEGMHLDAGDPLFDLYSPELQVAIGELIAARRAGGADGHGAAAVLFDTAREKLLLLGLGGEQVAQLARLERPPATVTFRSPITAHLTERLAYEGDAVQAGQTVLRLADRRRMWIEARVFERDLAAVTLGAPAVVTLPALPGTRLEGTISFIHPHLDPMTRTALVRMEVPNPDMALRQDMYATIEIDAPSAPPTVLAPRQAVIDTGTEQVVFLARPAGHFEPRTVTLGASGEDGLVQVLTGLSAGDEVVTSGQFLIDAESNFRSAIQRFLKEDSPQSPQRNTEGPQHVH